MIYDENRDRGFVILAVAFDTAGAAAVRDYIRPPDLQPAMFDFMGWDSALSARAAAPTYPCLVDERHVVGELYDIVNVPEAVWIDEEGHIVRPPEPAGASDSFRAMNPQTFEIPKEAAEDARMRRRIYVDAVVDWIRNGAKSRHVLSPEEVRRKMHGFDEGDSRAAAHFRLGVWLHEAGASADAQTHLDEAVRLRPASWTFRRQKIVLSDPAFTGQFAATPEYWNAVQALGPQGHYYPPVDMEGMPPPFRPEGVTPRK